MTIKDLNSPGTIEKQRNIDSYIYQQHSPTSPYRKSRSPNKIDDEQLKPLAS